MLKNYLKDFSSYFFWEDEDDVVAHYFLVLEIPILLSDAYTAALHTKIKS